jgi:hypothetical protein
MVDDKFDPSPSARRMEIRTGVGERRVFSAKEKGRICRGIHFAWRCRFRDCSLNRLLRRSAAILGPKWFTQRSTARLARSLGVALNEAESVRSQREKAKTPDAADLAMRGWAETNRSGLLAYPTVASRFLKLFTTSIHCGRLTLYLVWVPPLPVAYKFVLPFRTCLSSKPRSLVGRFRKYFTNCTHHYGLN